MTWRIPSQIPLPKDFQGFDPRSSAPQVEFHSYERHLPHWRMPGVCYLTIFRLNDSIPADVLQEMRDQLKVWKQRLLEAAAKHEGRLPFEENLAWDAFQRGHLLKLESLLDEGHGECLLRDESHRDLVSATLHHFEGRRCEMMAFVVMPNHLHALCRLLEGQDLEKLTGSWKRHSSEVLNRVTQRRGRGSRKPLIGSSGTPTISGRPCVTSPRTPSRPSSGLMKPPCGSTIRSWKPMVGLQNRRAGVFRASEIEFTADKTAELPAWIGNALPISRATHFL